MRIKIIQENRMEKRKKNVIFSFSFLFATSWIFAQSAVILSSPERRTAESIDCSLVVLQFKLLSGVKESWKRIFTNPLRISTNRVDFTEKFLSTFASYLGYKYIRHFDSYEDWISITFTFVKIYFNHQRAEINLLIYS